MLYRSLIFLVLALPLTLSAPARAASETAFDTRAFDSALSHSP